MKITQTSSILGIVGPMSRSQIFLHLLQYKLSGPITQLNTSQEADIEHVGLSDNNIQIL